MKRLSYVLALLGCWSRRRCWYPISGSATSLTAVSRVGWPKFGADRRLADRAVRDPGLRLGHDHAGPRIMRRRWVLIWGRMVRDASANCLPFSQVGGFVFGARAVTLQGVEWHTATASTVVDVTAEFLAQIAFACIGLVILVARAPRSGSAGRWRLGSASRCWPASGSSGCRKAPAAVRAYRPAHRRHEGSRMPKERVEVLQAEFGLIYGHTARLAMGFFVHLIGWICTGVAGWIAYRALGVPIDFDDALAIEALLSAAAALAFLVPVNAGVQEAGYAGLGAIFGVPPELSLGVSLVRRAATSSVGVPILLLWQFLEMRRLRLSKV